MPQVPDDSAGGAQSRLVQFDIAIENYIIALLLRDRSFYIRVAPFIKEKYFRPEVKKIVSAFLSYAERGIFLDRNALVSEACVSRSSVEYFFTEIRLKGVSIDYYVEQAVKMSKIYELERFVLVTANKIEHDVKGHGLTQTYDKLEKKLQQILSIGVAKELGADFYETAKTRLSKAPKLNEDRIPTGFKILDSKLHGGLARGEEGVILATPHRGKSMLVSNFGFGAVVRGYHVLHLTLEMSLREVMLRYDQRTANVTVEELKLNPRKVYEHIKKLRQVNGGKLVVREWTDKRPSVNELRAMMRMYVEERGYPDMVIVDYADLMRGDGSSADKRFVLSDIYTDLRVLANEYRFALWTISQANRGASNQDVLDLEHFAEAFDKAAIADVIIAICQKKDEKERGIVRLHIAKNRPGKSGDIIKCRTDFSRASIVEGD
jgi:replicative DNA helicase